MLAFAREQRAIADQAEANLLQAAVEWAAMHSTDSIDEAEMLVGYGDQGMPLAGEGAPLVAEFAVTEFAAAIGLSTDAGKAYVGHALELRHRLPRVWRRVVNGDLKAWQARRIADRTLLLSREAAAFVDAHVAPTAHKIGPYQLHALVEQAIAQFMPDLAEERRLAKADGRYFTIEPSKFSYDGTASVHGELDVADAQDLETAVAGLAAQLKDLGSEESLDVRRALAVGEMARAQMALDLNPTSVEPVETSRRQVVMYVHLSEQALAGAAGTARLERGNSQVTAGQVRDWCQHGRADGGEAGHRPRRPRPGRVTGGARQARRDRRASRQDLRLPLVQQTRAALRQGPLRPPRAWWADVSVQFGATLPTPSPDQDPRRLVVPIDRARHLPVDLQARLPVPPRHHRHPRRQPRPAPATRLATPPHTPPTGGAIPHARTDRRDLGGRVASASERIETQSPRASS